MEVSTKSKKFFVKLVTSWKLFKCDLDLRCCWGPLLTLKDPETNSFMQKGSENLNKQNNFFLNSRECYKVFTVKNFGEI